MTFTCTGIVLLFAQLTCTAPEIQVDAARFCRTAEPIRASRSDSLETRRQVAAHNAKWDALCRTSSRP